MNCVKTKEYCIFKALPVIQHFFDFTVSQSLSLPHSCLSFTNLRLWQTYRTVRVTFLFQGRYNIMFEGSFYIEISPIMLFRSAFSTPSSSLSVNQNWYTFATSRLCQYSHLRLQLWMLLRRILRWPFMLLLPKLFFPCLGHIFY